QISCRLHASTPISPSTPTGNPPCSLRKCRFNYFLPSWGRRRHVSCARIPAKVRGTRSSAAAQLQHLSEAYDRRDAIGAVQRRHAWADGPVGSSRLAIGPWRTTGVPAEAGPGAADAGSQHLVL